MRLFLGFILFSLSQLIISCSTNPETSISIDIKGEWHLSDLNSQNIIVLKKEGQELYAGTSDGIFANNFQSFEEDWNFLGLSTDSTSISSLTIRNTDEMLAVVRYDQFNADNDMLFRTIDGGQNWITDSNTRVDEADRFGLMFIKDHPYNPDDIFAIRGILLFSNDFGNNWEVIFSEGSNHDFLALSKDHPNHIWTGGDTAIMSPYLVKSTDGGQSWIDLSRNIEFESDAIVRDVILHHQHSEWVLAGLGGPVGPSNVVRKSTDGGETWETVLEETGVHVFVRSLQNPNLIYASGRDSSTKLFFAWTTDFGETWEKQIFEEGPDWVTTNDMVVMTIDGDEVLFFGTDKGLFSFSVE